MTGKAHAVKQARRILNQYRSAYDVSYNSGNYEIDPEKIAQLLGIEVLYHTFSDNISGVFFKKNNKLYIGVNSSQSEHRRRFTLAHEIGHFLLHADESLHLDQDSILYRADSILSSNETEANHFAAEILMPEECVRELIDSGIHSIHELANKFNISEKAMEYRLINLGYL